MNKRPTPSRPIQQEHCHCGCHGAEPRPQFAPTPATLATLEAERDQLKRRAELLEQTLDSERYLRDGYFEDRNRWQKEAERAQELVRKLAHALDEALDAATSGVRNDVAELFRDAVMVDPEVQAALEEVRKERG